MSAAHCSFCGAANGHTSNCELIKGTPQAGGGGNGGGGNRTAKQVAQLDGFFQSCGLVRLTTRAHAWYPLTDLILALDDDIWLWHPSLACLRLRNSLRPPILARYHD